MIAVTSAKLAGLAIDLIAMVVLTVAFVLFLCRDSRRLVPALLFALVLPWYLAMVALPQVSFYTDPGGGVTAFTFSSAVLLMTFGSILMGSPRTVRRILVSVPCLALVALALCVFVVQSWHLGLPAGLGITYVRVVQPLEIVVIFAWVVLQRKGLRRAMALLAIAIALAVVERYAIASVMGIAYVEDRTVGRVYLLGSYTIYGTLLAAAVVMIVSLVVTSPTPSARVLWLALGALCLSELALTKTRGALLGLSGLVVYLLGAKSRRLVTIVVAVTILAALGLGYRLPSTAGREVTLNLNRLLLQPNTRARVERNGAALDYVIHHPFKGVALGTTFFHGGSEIGSWVYNPYLAWGVAAGILGLLAFAVMMVWSLWASTRAVFRSTGDERVLLMGVLGALVAWLMNQWTTGDSLTYVQRPEAGLFFYAVIGIVVGVSTASHAQGEQTCMSVTEEGILAPCRGGPDSSIGCQGPTFRSGRRPT